MSGPNQLRYTLALTDSENDGGMGRASVERLRKKFEAQNKVAVDEFWAVRGRRGKEDGWPSMDVTQ
jgi:hypothetical protein